MNFSQVNSTIHLALRRTGNTAPTVFTALSNRSLVCKRIFLHLGILLGPFEKLSYIACETPTPLLYHHTHIVKAVLTSTHLGIGSDKNLHIFAPQIPVHCFFVLFCFVVTVVVVFPLNTQLRLQIGWIWIIQNVILLQMHERQNADCYH